MYFNFDFYTSKVPLIRLWPNLGQDLVKGTLRQIVKIKVSRQKKRIGFHKTFLKS